jgi:hypothetical protein
MIRLALRSILLAVTLAVTGCANVKLDATSATPVIVEKLRAANIAPAQVGTFKLAQGKAPAMDTSLSGLRGNTLLPAKGSWSQLLKDTLVTELSAAGLYNTASGSVIEGQLTDSRVDAAIGTGAGRLAARFTVTNAGSLAYDKEVAAEANWESSFMGGVAIPTAINQYGALYKALVTKLVDDPDFRRALAK